MVVAEMRKRRLHLYEIKSGMEMTPFFARNIVTCHEVLGADLLTSSIVYSGPSNRHLDPAYINYGDI